MDPGHMISIVFLSSVFGVLFGAFVTVFLVGVVAFNVGGENADTAPERLLWGMICFVMLALSLFPLQYVVRELWRLLG